MLPSASPDEGSPERDVLDSQRAMMAGTSGIVEFLMTGQHCAFRYFKPSEILVSEKQNAKLLGVFISELQQTK